MTAPDTDNKLNPLDIRQRRCEEMVNENCCSSSKASRCHCGLSWQEQKKCQYALKSNVNNKCMHYMESIDGQCDCVDVREQ